MRPSWVHSTVWSTKDVDSTDWPAISYVMLRYDGCDGRYDGLRYVLVVFKNTGWFGGSIST